jgi:hypothetical protein
MRDILGFCLFTRSAFALGKLGIDPVHVMVTPRAGIWRRYPSILRAVVLFVDPTCAGLRI